MNKNLTLGICGPIFCTSKKFEKWVLGSVGALFLKILIVTAKGTCLHKYTLIA